VLETGKQNLKFSKDYGAIFFSWRWRRHHVPKERASVYPNDVVVQPLLCPTGVSPVLSSWARDDCRDLGWGRLASSGVRARDSLNEHAGHASCLVFLLHNFIMIPEGAR
jgi:hypothetical protein